MNTPPPPIPGAPLWPYCAYGADPATDPVGCRGVHVPGHTACLAHLADADRDAYLAGLTPGTDIDHRGTSFTEPLLNALLDALRDPATGHPRLGDAWFGFATFQGIARFAWVSFQGRTWFGWATFQRAWFKSATFQGDARFESATFQDLAVFESATFQGGGPAFDSATFESDAWFNSVIVQARPRFDPSDPRFDPTAFQADASFLSVTFRGDTRFQSAVFRRNVGFGSATFQGDALFPSATFEGLASFKSAAFESVAIFESAAFQSVAWFGSATFQDDAWFGSATFGDDAEFNLAVFEQLVSLGPLVCAGRVTLSGAVFSGPATLPIGARRLECQWTRWSSTAELRLRYATVDFSHAVFEYPLTIAAESAPFVLPDGRPVPEHAFADAPGATVRMASLRGVDAAHLVLADVDLSRCLVTGTVHLDQIRLEGTCSFNEVPPGTHWRRWRPVRFTQRRTLAEEHHWRANQPTAVRGWNAAVFGTGHVGPGQLAPVYRALRKAFEDGKNEPGAADFYYGEMEMRRHDRTGTTRAERGLLHGYWMLSGYGLRASRALGWLAAAMLVTIVLLMGFGLPQDSPKQEATGTVPPGGGKITFEIDEEDPQNPTGNRFTGERFEKALNVTLNSVVFRSSGQDLTTAGTYIEMTSRLLEPALLALAVLAIRGRIKR
ncbi:pentapeptide repeat-containing protein [Streptomyces sp. NPDC059455]|uniref:pentapeptide repeat-containing protein n=1 Tax=Streptomyces sp. NPDC059455 TaxID=3346837 RepID=UPI0036CC75B2